MDLRTPQRRTGQRRCPLGDPSDDPSEEMSSDNMVVLEQNMEPRHFQELPEPEIQCV